MSFAAFTPRSRWLDGHLVLARRVDSPRFQRVETYSRRNVVQPSGSTPPDEVDDELSAWLAEAYQVGQQRHLARCPPASHRPRAGITRFE